MINQIPGASAPLFNFYSISEEVELPDEVIVQILQKLTPWDMHHTSLVSKQWARVSDDPSLWKLFADKLSLLALHDTELHSERKKKVIQCCKSASLLGTLKARHLYFKTSALEVFYLYAATYREKTILFPEYLMAMKEFDFGELAFSINKEEIFNLFIDINEEELIFQFFHDFDFLPSVIDGNVIISQDLPKLCTDDKLKFFPILRIFQRLLEKNFHALIAANLYKCRLDFEIKLEIISNLIESMNRLPWFQRFLILTTLKSNLQFDHFLSAEQNKTICSLLGDIPDAAPIIPLPKKIETSKILKNASLLLTLIKKKSFYLSGLAAAVSLKEKFRRPYTLSPLSLKVSVFFGLFLVGIHMLEKRLETKSEYDLNGLIDQAIQLIDTSKNFIDWKQELTDHKILNPLIYKACHAAKIPYKKSDELQTLPEIYGLFYALHFAVNQYTQNTQNSENSKTTLFQLVEFLEHWRHLLISEIFIKQDALYQAPSYFRQTQQRQALAIQRTQEALQIYDIKKKARKFGIIFSETIQTSDDIEKIEVMAKAIKECTDLEEWAELLEKKHLLKDLLRLAQPNLPPHYRCVSSGKLLFSGVSHEGHFYDANTFNTYRKTQNEELSFLREYETSWKLFSAINQVFRNHYMISDFSNQEIIDCLTLLTEKGLKHLSKISKLDLPRSIDDDALAHFEDEHYRSCRTSYLRRPYYLSSQVKK